MTTGENFWVSTATRTRRTKNFNTESRLGTNGDKRSTLCSTLLDLRWFIIFIDDHFFALFGIGLPHSDRAKAGGDVFDLIPSVESLQT